MSEIIEALEALDSTKKEETVKEDRTAKSEPEIKIKKIKNPTKINANKLIKLIQTMDPDDFPAYSNVLKQYHKYKKKAIILELIQIIQDNWESLVE